MERNKIFIVPSLRWDCELKGDCMRHATARIADHDDRLLIVHHLFAFGRVIIGLFSQY